MMNVVLPFDFGELVRLKNQKQSPIAAVTSYETKFNGTLVLIQWCHEGQIKSEWVPLFSLEKAPE